MNKESVDNTTLLGPNDPAPFEIYNPGGTAQGMLVADHASNYIPPHLNNLGLSNADFHRHIAYDIGTDLLTRKLADHLDMRALIAQYSRLIVDLNRRYEHNTLIPDQGEGKPIPGNKDLDPNARHVRLNEIYEPYHQKIQDMLNAYIDNDQVPVLISIHSFNREFFKVTRPWDIGVLWARDRRVSDQVHSYFQARGYSVDNNKPYDLRLLSGSTTSWHGDGRAIPNVLIEIRNDLLDSEASIENWAQELGNCFQSILADPSIYSYCTEPEFRHNIACENTYYEELVEKAKRGERI